MKLKTSLTLSEDLVATLDRLAGRDISRSAFIEKILRDFVEGRAQARRDARETAAINRHAVNLNAEMNDARSFVRTGAKLHHGSGVMVSSAGGVKMLRR